MFFMEGSAVRSAGEALRLETEKLFGPTSGFRLGTGSRFGGKTGLRLGTEGCFRTKRGFRLGTGAQDLERIKGLFSGACSLKRAPSLRCATGRSGADAEAGAEKRTCTTETQRRGSAETQRDMGEENGAEAVAEAVAGAVAGANLSRHAARAGQTRCFAAGRLSR